MEEPSVQLHLPDGRTIVAGPDAILGRSTAATVRIDDPRVSTVHAELSWRADGFVLLARGGRLRVGGRAVREVVLAPGLEIELAPAVVVGVGTVREGRADVVPSTIGRDRLRIVLAEGGVDLFRGRGIEPVVTLTGVSARIFAAVARQPGQVVRWDQVAEAVWSEEGALRARTREGSSARPAPREAASTRPAPRPARETASARPARVGGYARAVPREGASARAPRRDVLSWRATPRELLSWRADPRDAWRATPREVVRAAPREVPSARAAPREVPPARPSSSDDPQPDRWTAIDERRLRNRWDQALRVLRKSLEPLGRDALLEVAGGTLALRLEPGDVVEG